MQNYEPSKGQLFTLAKKTPSLPFQFFFSVSQKSLTKGMLIGTLGTQTATVFLFCYVVKGLLVNIGYLKVLLCKLTW